MKLTQLLKRARACQICAPHLPDGCRPLLQGSTTSKLLIIGQAPGAAAHATGVPWDDRSGDRLRDWLGLSGSSFLDPKRVALMPMGFCYPGTGTRGDLRPRPECAPEWHASLLAGFADVELTVITGRYAFERCLAGEFKTITEATQAHATLLPNRIALPHPSPRNNLWLKKHPWFEADVLPQLRSRVKALVGHD